MMTENKTPVAYFFRLTPVGKFFFGNERTFGQGEEANYFVRSNAFPQQTSILGMLRLELLKNGKGTFPIDATNKDKVEKRIGKASFNHSEMEQTFGLINKISPVFICHGENDVYFPSPKNWHFPEKEIVEGKAYRMNFEGKMQEVNLPNFPQFDHKKHFSPRFQNLAGEQKKCEQIFIEQSQIGIQKAAKDESRDESNKGFYKQFYYTFQKGYSFCFWANFDEAIEWKSTIVYLGADRSAFRLDVVAANWENDYKQKFTTETVSDNAIYLLSDAYVGDDFYQHCEFAVSDVVDFRYIQSTIDKAELINGQKPKKINVKLQLLQRGTVIYPKKDDFVKLQEQLNNDTFQKIGYNIFKTI